MKKVIAIMLVFAMCFTLFGCKVQNDVEDTAKPLEKLQNEAENQTENKNENPQPEPEKDKQPEIENAPVPQDEYDYLYSDYEILVTLTKDETDKNIKYTVDDFKNLDLSYVYKLGNYAEYFEADKQTEDKYNDKTTLVLFLESPGKQKIYNAIEVLKKDERVFLAQPCALEIGQGDRAEIEVETKSSFSENFLNDKNTPEYKVVAELIGIETFYTEISVSKKNIPNILAIIKQLEKNDEFLSVKIKYDKYYGTIEAVAKEPETLKSADDFPLLSLKEISIKQQGSKEYVYLTPNDSSVYNIRKYVQILKQDERIERVWFEYEIILYMEEN